MMNIERIWFEERYDSKEYGTTTFYFVAPKEMLNGKYPEAETMEISIELPTNNMDARYASVMFSPTKYYEEDGYVDYDWFDAEMPYEDVEALIKLAEEHRFTIRRN